MSLALYLPEMLLCSKDSTLGPLKIEGRIFLEGVRGEGAGGLAESQRMSGLGWLPSPEPTLSPARLLSKGTVVPFVEMTSFPYQATATSHPNGLRPQQDHPDSGRYHLSPPTREYLSKGGRDRELFSPVYLVPCLGQLSPQPRLTAVWFLPYRCPRSEVWRSAPLCVQ